MDTYKLSRTLGENGHAGKIASVSFSPDGHQFATGGYDGKVKLWDVVTGEVLLTLYPPLDICKSVNSVSFSPSGAEIIAAPEECKRNFGYASWNLITGEPESWGAPIEYIGHLAYNPAGTHIVSIDDNRITILDAITKEKVNSVDDIAFVNGVKFTPDGNKIITIAQSTVNIYDVESLNKIRSIDITNEYKNNPDISVYSVDISPDGKRILINVRVEDIGDCFMELRSMQDLKLLNRTLIEDSDAISSKFSPDGRIIVSGGSHIRIWNAETLEFLNELNTLQPSIYDCFAFNNDGSKLVTAGTNIKIWDSRDWETMRAIDESIQEVRPDIPPELVGKIASYTSKSDVPDEFTRRATGNLPLYPEGKGGKRKRRTKKRKKPKRKQTKRMR
jgi:WD40 repeat protein